MPREIGNEGPVKGGTYVMGTKDKADLQGGGDRGAMGTRRATPALGDGPIRTVPLTEQSRRVGWPHLPVSWKKTEGEEDPDFLGQAQSRP